MIAATMANLLWSHTPAHMGGTGISALILTMLYALSCCFLGYVIFRIHLVIAGLFYGAFGGALLVHWFRPQPSGLDYFVICTCIALLLGLLAWLLFRLTFAALTGLSAVLVLALAFGSPASTGAWILSVAAGLLAAGIAFVFMRPVIILATALLGGLTAVLCAATVVAGGPEALRAATIAGEGSTWLTILLVCIGLAFSAAGICTQVTLLRAVRISLAPEKKRRTAPSGSTKVRPRFVRK